MPVISLGNPQTNFELGSRFLQTTTISSTGSTQTFDVANLNNIIVHFVPNGPVSGSLLVSNDNTNFVVQSKKDVTATFTSITALTTNLIHYYSFEGGSSPDLVSGSNGTVSGAIGSNTAPGGSAIPFIGSNLFFDGTNDSVTLNGMITYKTINVWARLGSTFNGIRLVFDNQIVRGDVGSDGLSLYTPGLDLIVEGRVNGSLTSKTITNGFVDQSWHMYTLTSTGSVLNIWRDATWLGSIIYGGAIGTVGSKLVIGWNAASPGNTNYPWYGEIDEFGIWTRQLTDAEIGSLYNGGSGLTHPLTSYAGITSDLIGLSPVNSYKYLKIDVNRHSTGSPISGPTKVVLFGKSK